MLIAAPAPDLTLYHDLGDGWAFYVTREYVNAWGHHCVLGTLFDIRRGAVQSGALAWVNYDGGTVAEILAGALREATR